MIPKDWIVVELKEASLIQTGKGTKRLESGQYEIIGANGLIGYSNEFIEEGEFVYTGRVGTIGLTNFYSGKPVWISDNVLYIKRKGITPIKLIYYALKRIDYSYLNVGSTQPLIKQSDLKKLKIAIPKDSKEQKAIAKILSDLDEKIEVNRKMNEILEELGQTLFKRWFVDFEFPDEKGKPYKSSGGGMIRSELGDIPGGWEVKNLSEISRFKNGINYGRNENGDTRFRIINVRDLVENNFISCINLDAVNIDRKKALPYLINPKTDILIARSASPGEVGIIPDSEQDVIYSGFSIRFRLNEELFFYYLYFNLLQFQDEFKNYSTGTTLKNINQQILTSKKIIIPKKINLAGFNNLIKSLFDKIINNVYEIKSLEQIRDSLLPKLMAGKIMVKA